MNADIRKHCDELAEQGYLALAADLYWRQEPGVDPLDSPWKDYEIRKAVLNPGRMASTP